MDCPRCGSNLKVAKHKGIEVDRCVSCEGMWLDYPELDQLEDTVLDADEQKGSMITRPGESEIACPKCQGPMQQFRYRYNELWLDVCAAEHGFWLDKGEETRVLELMDQRMTVAVENWLHAGLPTEAAAILLAEVVGETEGVESQAGLIADIARSNDVSSIEIAETEEHRALLWKGRKSAFGAMAQLASDYYLHDAVVPRTKLVDTMKGVYEIADRYDLTLLNVFHAGDGNLHPLISFDADEPGMSEKVHKAGDEIVALCLRNGGALSGEHGIGVEKRDMMRATFTELDLDAQARLKEVFDPAGIFNPNKILPEGSRCFDFGGARRDLPEGAWV